MNKTCRSCQKIFPLTKEFFFSNGKTPKGAEKWKPTCKTCETSERYGRTESIFTDMFEKIECSVCGYDKCEAALELHHLDPTKKEIRPSALWSSRRNKDKIIKEFEKCVLLCANCHREVHAGVTKLGS